jgi:hypothetical protein
MANRFLVRSRTAAMIGILIYACLAAKGILALISFRELHSHLPFSITLGYLTCIVLGVLLVVETPSGSEKAVCGFTALCFLFLFLSRLPVLQSQYALTVLANTSWIIAMMFLLIRYSDLRKSVGSRPK